MAEPKREPKGALVNWRVTVAERDHLHKVAAERSTTITGLLREALRKEGALPTS